MIRYETIKEPGRKAGKTAKRVATRESPPATVEPRDSRVATLRDEADAVDPAAIEEGEGPLSTVPVRLSRLDLEWVDAMRGDKARAAFIRSLVRAGRRAVGAPTP